MARAVSKTFPELSGDLAEKSDGEMRLAFPNPIKGVGADVKPASLLKFRREKMAIGGLPNTGKDEVV